jgi:murein DD-endopeptidase MepM/ murein hydrolase activator NlpD
MLGNLAKAIIWLAPLFLAAACSQSVPAPVVQGGKAADDARRAPRPAAVALAVGNYTVAADETLYAIARKSGVNLRDLIAANNLRPPYRLLKGQRLQIPTVRYHRVAAGETLYSISRQYRVSVYALARQNQVSPPYRIRPGQRLRLPASEGRRDRVAGLSGSGTGEGASSNIVRDAIPRPGWKPKKGQKTARARVVAPATAPVTTKPPARASSRFAWPVRGRVISRFGVKPNGLHNDGINIAVKRGTAVRAAENGVVVYAGNELRGFGNLLLLRHKGGWLTAYGHNQSLAVKVGDVVRQGQPIARSGSTGNISQPQLHFEIRKGRRAVNPTRYLSTRRAALQVGASLS